MQFANCTTTRLAPRGSEKCPLPSCGSVHRLASFVIPGKARNLQFTKHRWRRQVPCPRLIHRVEVGPRLPICSGGSRPVCRWGRATTGSAVRDEPVQDRLPRRLFGIAAQHKSPIPNANTIHSLVTGLESPPGKSDPVSLVNFRCLLNSGSFVLHN